MTQPIPTNLHPSQCYRLLDPERDTLQDGDEMIMERPFAEPKWEPWSAKTHNTTIDNFTIARRQFTPPAPVQVQEFWRLLDVGEARQLGDQFQYPLTNRWVDISPIEVGKSVLIGAPQHRRRVTVPVAAPAPVADAPKAESSGDYGNYRQRLFEYFDRNFGHAPIVSEMDEVEHIVLGYHHKPSAVPLTESGPFLVSVDGHEAPTMEHATIEDARIEAERLARQEHPAQVRLLRQVAVARADMTVKWDNNQTK